MKKQIVIPVCCVLSAALIGGSIYGVMKFNDSRIVVDVLPVSMLSTQYWNSSSSYGYVTSNVSQQIYLEEKQVISDIYVQEGDTVSIGDKLVAFDTTLSELDMADKQIELQQIDLQIKDLNKQIEQIKANKVPENISPSFDDFNSSYNDGSDEDGNIENVVMRGTPSSGIRTAAYISNSGSGGIIPVNLKVTENPQETEDESDSQFSEAEDVLDFSTEPSESTGTYEVLCTDETIITREFINKIRGCDEDGSNQNDDRALIVVLKTPEHGSWITLNGSRLPELTDDEIPTRLGQFRKNGNKMNTYPKKLDGKTDILHLNGQDVVYCTPNTEITAAFLKLISESEASGTRTVILKIKGQKDYTLDPKQISIPADESEIDTTSIDYFIKNNGFKIVEPEPETQPETDAPETDDPGVIDPGDDPGIVDPGIDDPGILPGDDPGLLPGGEPGGDAPVYSQDEIKQLVTEKEQEIAKLQTQRKQAQLDMTKLQKEIDGSVVTSSVNGVVKTAVDPASENSGIESGQPFIVVQSEEGLYLTGTIDEMQLNHVSVGQNITANSYMSGSTFTAEITEISDYPTENQMGWSENANLSYYPFKAYIEDADGLTNGENVDIMMDSLNADPDAADTLYLLKAYIRQDDDGSSYVYVRDDQQKLKKQTVITGKSLYSSYTEIKEGLTINDYIAFPYGKNLKDGVKTKEGSPDNIVY